MPERAWELKSPLSHGSEQRKCNLGTLAAQAAKRLAHGSLTPEWRRTPSPIQKPSVVGAATRDQVSHAIAAATMACVPVSRVGWMTGAKPGLWLNGMSWEMLPASAAR